MTSESELNTLYDSDYLEWDGVVALTVATDRHSNEGGDKSDIVAFCKPTPLRNARKAFGDIQVMGHETAFTIPDALLVNIRAAGQELRQGDKLTDLTTTPDTIYTLQNTTKAVFGTQWIVLCNRNK